MAGRPRKMWYEGLLCKPLTRNYSEKEIQYYLEVLPVNRKSVILNKKSNGKKRGYFAD